MSVLVFTLRAEPEQRLNLSTLVPHRLDKLTQREIESIAIETTKVVTKVGDMFRVRKGDPAQIRFAGGSRRFDRIAEAMTAGTILVEGDVGARAGRLMNSGTLTVSGSAGPWVGSGMEGGSIIVAGDVGEWLGGPLPGEMAGMRGGVVTVKGNAGREAGHRLRRGTIIIGKKAGPYAGRAMIAGTLIIAGGAGPLPGYLMRRGTIVLNEAPEQLSPTFADSGPVELVFARLLAELVKLQAPAAAKILNRPLRRLSGDLALEGKGEILLPV